MTNVILEAFLSILVIIFFGSSSSDAFDAWIKIISYHAASEFNADATVFTLRN